LIPLTFCKALSLILYQANRHSNHYLLKQVGQSQRLYRNGVFHSQARLSSLANGGVWDMLWLPAFIRSPQNIRRVLMLGVGLGAALVKLRCFLPHADIVAVDIDPVHLRLAKQLVKKVNVSVSGRCQWVQADAIDWLIQLNQRAGDRHLTADDSLSADGSAYATEPKDNARFDLIIDDLFIDRLVKEPHQSHEASRVIGLLQSPDIGEEKHKNRTVWLEYLHNVMQPSALLIANCERAASVSEAYRYWLKKQRNAFGLSLSCRQFENRVLVVNKAQAYGADQEVYFSDKISWLKNTQKAVLNSHWHALRQTGEVAAKNEAQRLLRTMRVRKL